MTTQHTPPKPHVHASDGNCDCHYQRKCIGGCGRVGWPDEYGKFLCDRCERADRENR